jgi:hypothetical protein
MLNLNFPTCGQYSKALSDLTNNRLMKIVIDKDVDIDGDFDKFVKEWLAAGGQKMTDEANAEFAKKK